MSSRPAVARYARALADLAEHARRLQAVRADLRALRELEQATPELRAFLGNYLVPAGRRQSAIRELFEARTDPLTYRFLLLLEERHGLHLAPAVSDALEEQCERATGVLRATVTSAAPLDDEQVSALAARLRQRLNRPVKLAAAADPSLLGGFKVRMEDRVYDASVAHQLDRFKRGRSSA